MHISRRRFLELTTAAGAAAMLSGRIMADPLGLPVGIQLYAVREPMEADPVGTLKQLHEIGYREVEAAGYGKLTAKDYGKMIADAGLSCPSAHLAFKKGIDFGPLFDDAHALGCTFATSSAIFPPKNVSPTPANGFGLDGFKWMADLMQDIGTKAKAAGLKYAYHNHSPEFVTLPDGIVGYDYLLKNTDAELVKFEIDCGWMCVAGKNPVEYMKKYPGRFRMLHIKDFKKSETAYTSSGSGPRPDGVELGDGFIQYKPIFTEAKKAGIVHVFAEQEKPYAVSPMESAKVDYKFLHSFS
jgi:sugar phosphate isomerase/epimerase